MYNNLIFIDIPQCQAMEYIYMCVCIHWRVLLTVTQHAATLNANILYIRRGNLFVEQSVDTKYLLLINIMNRCQTDATLRFPEAHPSRCYAVAEQFLGRSRQGLHTKTSSHWLTPVTVAVSNWFIFLYFLLRVYRKLRDSLDSLSGQRACELCGSAEPVI